MNGEACGNSTFFFLPQRLLEQLKAIPPSAWGERLHWSPDEQDGVYWLEKTHTHTCAQCRGMIPLAAVGTWLCWDGDSCCITSGFCSRQMIPESLVQLHQETHQTHVETHVHRTPAQPFLHTRRGTLLDMMGWRIPLIKWNRCVKKCT